MVVVPQTNGVKDWFARSEAQQTRLPWLLLACVVLLEIVPVGCHRSASVVTAYIAQDQVYAEPILAQFTKETGIKVRAVFDSEAVKTVAIANRLLAERGHPQCDVFWGNEELRTRQLAAEGVFRETNAWTAVGFRSRRLVINTNRMSLAEAPKSLLELTNTAWRGQMAMAYPLFGTTATHLLALRHRWGDAAWVAWCRALQASRPFVSTASVVVQFVARARRAHRRADSGDIAAAAPGRARGGAVLTAESLLIPKRGMVQRRILSRRKNSMSSSSGLRWSNSWWPFARWKEAGWPRVQPQACSPIGPPCSAISIPRPRS
jgi:hypothetical protein